MRRAALLALVCLFASACNLIPTTSSSPTPIQTPRKRTIDAAGLREAFMRLHLQTFKVTYSINGTFDKQAIAGHMETYQILTLRRIDTTLGNGSDYQAFTLYLDEDTIVACTLPLVPPCEEITPDEAANAALGVVLLDETIKESPEVLDRAEIAEDRIAGQPVSCFLVREQGATKLQRSLEVNACYTADGILLRYGVTSPTFDIELNALLLVRDVATQDVKLPPNAFRR